MALKPEPAGIFPLVDPTAKKNDGERDLAWFYDGFHTYSSVDADDAAADEINKLMDSGFVETFSSYTSVCEYLDDVPVISKLAMIIR